MAPSIAHRTRPTRSTVSSSLTGGGRRCVLVAAGTPTAAESFVRRHGFDPTLVLRKADLMVRPSELRRRVAAADADVLLVHSSDWRRQPAPQLYDLALLVMPARDRAIIDESRGTVRWINDVDLAYRAARTVPHAISAGATIAAEALRISLATWRRATPQEISNQSAAPSVLAIWPGSGHSYGGSISHLTGILGGFRRAGLRIGIVTTAPPADEVRAVADVIEVIAPLPPRARATGDCIQIGSNRPLKIAAMQLAWRLRPGFIYQRHSPFLTTGAEISRVYRLPLVLEWNSSEVYIRQNWNDTLPIERCLDPLLEASERAVVADASLIAAVSTEAANMAARAGAAPEKLLVLPNAVDIGYVDRCLNGTANRSGGFPSDPRANHVLGWAGTFGGWHGAAMIVRAMPALPADVHLVMIGDGAERRACEALATDLGVAERIEWAGSLSRPEALRRLASCDLLVSPHVPLENGEPFFGSPTKLFEYMALGRPIVASRLAQIGEILEDGVTARLVTPGDVTDLANGIVAVLSSSDRGSHLGDAARLEALAHHTWDHRAEAVLDRLAKLPHG